MRFTIFQDSKIGGRKVNQDRLAYSYYKDTLLMVIADGLGGYARGEIAAEIAVNTLNHRFQAEARTVLQRPREFLESAVHAAHRAIVAFADKHDLLECPRTTIVAVILQNGIAQWAHVGDSRLYYFRSGRLATATQDHSRVQQMVEAGVITSEQAAVHPDRNKIYNCLGGVIPPTIAHSDEWKLQVGDSIWISTDGFWGPLSAAEIATRLSTENILSLAPKLMEEAEDKAGAESDNLSVVALTWEMQDEDLSTAVDDGTVTIPMAGFSSTMNTTHEFAAAKDEISDDEIERTIAEIQNAIKRVNR
ncbi:MAG: serine/threonine-protein phosphatase [Rhodocyclaceae bacterium]|jgi:serine/threonine protein phosphatase PrpC|nr:serine/threonine-protein phosphatase [Rhodocyclaceae bacterium]MCE2723486.1 serine/threonine-protein phosphatase [Betaproteobacteria bacterium]MCA3023634.1 serine/threonine-protein phosphatase [Rhodocyclaceae bacterium]MCA3030001.1 serine/threonine-protein phosphatase [Rhodocyclaceae bacterium]MCA3034994.1 serine/threonine-protein phosphatase [Rhodocyclaceae bacterium]